MWDIISTIALHILISIGRLHYTSDQLFSFALRPTSGQIKGITKIVMFSVRAEEKGEGTMYREVAIFPGYLCHIVCINLKGREWCSCAHVQQYLK